MKSKIADIIARVKKYKPENKEVEITEKELKQINMCLQGFEAAVKNQNYKLFNLTMLTLKKAKLELVREVVEEGGSEMLRQKAVAIIKSNNESLDIDALAFCAKAGKHFLNKEDFRKILIEFLFLSITFLVNVDDKQSLDKALKLLDDVYGSPDFWDKIKEAELGEFLEQSLSLIFNTKEDFSIKFTQLFHRDDGNFSDENVIDKMLIALKSHKKNKEEGIYYRDEYGRSFLHLATSAHVPARVLEKMIGYYKRPQKMLDVKGLSPLKYALKSGSIGIEQFMMWAEAYPGKLGKEHLELVNGKLLKLVGGLKPGSIKYHYHHIKRALSAYGVDDISQEDSKEDGFIEDDMIAQKVFDLATYRPAKLLQYNGFNPTELYGDQKKNILQFLIEQPQSERFGKGAGPDLATKLLIKHKNLKLVSSNVSKDDLLHKDNPILLALVNERPGIFCALLHCSLVEDLSVVFQTKCSIGNKNYKNLFHYLVDQLDKPSTSIATYYNAMQITVQGFCEDLYPSSDPMQKKDPITNFLKIGQKPTERAFDPGYLDITKEDQIIYNEFLHKGYEADTKIRNEGSRERAKLNQAKLCSTVNSIMELLTFNTYSSLIDEMVWRYCRNNEISLDAMIGKAFYKKKKKYDLDDVYDFVARIIILDSCTPDGLIQNYELLPQEPDHNIILSVKDMAIQYADAPAPVDKLLEFFNPNGFSI